MKKKRFRISRLRGSVTIYNDDGDVVATENNNIIDEIVPGILNSTIKGFEEEEDKMKYILVLVDKHDKPVIIDNKVITFSYITSFNRIDVRTILYYAFIEKGIYTKDTSYGDVADELEDMINNY